MPDLSQFSLPISIFLVVYIGFMVFYVLYSLFNIYHLIRYGVYGFGLYLLVTIFTMGTILLFFGSVSLLSGYNWQYPITLSGIMSSNQSIFPGL